MKKFFAMILAISLGFCSGYIAYAETVSGWDEPYDIPNYYSLTTVSIPDSEPSPFAMMDLESQGGNVYDYTRHIKSILFAEKFNNILEVTTEKTKNAEINGKSFGEEIFKETADALEILQQGNEKISKQIDLEKMESILNQGDADEFEDFNPNFNHEEKFAWIDQQYKNFADGANQEISDFQNVMEIADKILNHSNLAQGDLQIQQARNELLTLLTNELARKNSLNANFEQMQALYQSVEYDKNVESAYIDSMTKFNVADPYDTENYRLLQQEHNYQKPAPVGMPDFK